MLRKILPLALAALLGNPLAQAIAEPATKVGVGRTAPTTRNRIVIQVNEGDPKKWNAVLANIRNIQTELGAKNVAIAVVAIGEGLGMLDAISVSANGVQDALATGVGFLACGNSMRAQHVEKADLIEGVGVTAAGYVELMKRQQQGWAYLRP